jgi:hypothetical protein
MSDFVEMQVTRVNINDAALKTQRASSSGIIY